MNEELKVGFYHVHCMNCGWEIASPEVAVLRKQLDIAMRAIDMHIASEMDGWEHFKIAKEEIEKIGAKK